MSKQHPKRPRPALPARLQPWLDSWTLAMDGADTSARTRTIYLDVLRLFGGWLDQRAPKVRDWDEVGRDDLRRFFVWLKAPGELGPCEHWLSPVRGDRGACAGYGQAYVNNVARSLQQFFAWLAEEEELPNPMLGLKIPAAPKLGDQVVEVIPPETMALLIKDAERNRDFESRRDAAILRMFAATGCRLAEIAHLDVDDVDQPAREALVTGKGRRQRRVRYDSRAALAVDRYKRLRAKRTGADTPALWLSRTGSRLTTNGIYQMIVRRGARLGIKIHPHQLRHTFAHNFLDAGGREGDLMELTGWQSPRMLELYGRSARSARARRAYDDLDVMRGV